MLHTSNFTTTFRVQRQWTLVLVRSLDRFGTANEVTGCKIATGQNHHRFAADKDSPVAQLNAPILQTLQSVPLNFVFPQGAIG